ncbi:MFS transporter [Streptomyces sp. NBC_00466]|uniref:MFS transporter n=1 Tax=Streptomyces sp. NBC_00466 TaxID=2903655 RepID=UPI0030E5CC8B
MPIEAVPPAPSSPHTATRTAPAQPGRWRQISLLGGLLSVDNGESSVIPVLFPALRTALGLPLSALGALLSVAKMATVLCGPLWVVVAQRYPRKNVLAVCCGLWGVWTVAAGFAQNYWQLLILITVAAAGIAGGGPLTNALLADLFDDRTRGRAAGYLYGLAILGTGLAGPLLGGLADVKDGWRYGFFAMGGVQIAFGLLALAFLRDPGVGASEPQLAALKARSRSAGALDRRRLRELARNRTLVLLCLQRLTTGQFVLLGFGVTFLVDVRGFSNAQASLTTLPVAVCFCLGTVLGGLTADRVHRRFPRAGRIATMQADVLAYALIAAVATQIPWKSLTVYFVLFGALSCVQGFMPGLNRPCLISAVVPELRSAALSIMLSAEAAGWALTTLLAGYIGDAFGLQAAFLWLAVLLTLANGALIGLLYRPSTRDAATVQQELDRRADHARTLDS